MNITKITNSDVDRICQVLRQHSQTLKYVMAGSSFNLDDLSLHVPVRYEDNHVGITFVGEPESKADESLYLEVVVLSYDEDSPRLEFMHRAEEEQCIKLWLVEDAPEPLRNLACDDMAYWVILIPPRFWGIQADIPPCFGAVCENYYIPGGWRVIFTRSEYMSLSMEENDK
jgi:hypothetical protein